MYTPRLKQVHTKGVEGNYLTAIRLVFEGGVETPLFDGLHKQAQVMRTFNISDPDVRMITAQEKAGYVSKMSFDSPSGCMEVFNMDYECNELIRRFQKVTLS